MLIKRNNAVLAANGILAGAAINSALLDLQHNNFLAGLAPNNNVLPVIPPIEKHPYSALMPLDQEYERYIIGTFPPPSYLTDVLGFPILVPGGGPLGVPEVPFFHGNVGGLWKSLFTATGDWLAYIALNGANLRNVRKNFIINWLTENSINICDIISYVSRTAYNAQDSNLVNIYPNIPLMATIFSSKKEPYLLFNTSSCFGAAGLKVRQNGQLTEKPASFDLFLKAFQNIGASLYIDFMSNNNPNLGWIQLNAANGPLIADISYYKCLIKLKIVFNNSTVVDDYGFNKGQKEVYCIFGPSPARQAALQLAGNAIYQQAIAGPPQAPMNHPNFCTFMYSQYLNFTAGGQAVLHGLNA